MVKGNNGVSRLHDLDKDKDVLFIMLWKTDASLLSGFGLDKAGVDIGCLGKVPGGCWGDECSGCLCRATSWHLFSKASCRITPARKCIEYGEEGQRKPQRRSLWLPWVGRKAGARWSHRDLASAWQRC